MNNQLASLIPAVVDTTEQGLSISLAIGLIGAGLLLAVFFIAALVSVLRAPLLTGAGMFLWILVIFAFPFLGPLGWFILGRKHPPYLAAQKR